MELKRHRGLAYVLLAGVWLIVAGWQVQEHWRVVSDAKSDLRNRSREIASTLGAVTRALRFRDAVFQERLEPVLSELVSNSTNTLVRSSGLAAIALLNTDGEPVVTVGNTNLLLHELSNERWSEDIVTFVFPIEGAKIEGVTNNPTIVIPPFSNFTNDASRGRSPRREPRPADTNAVAGTAAVTNTAGSVGGVNQTPAGTGERPRGDRRRSPWMRFMSEGEFRELAAKRELHGLVLVMTTESYRAVCKRDLWLRCVISFFAFISVFGAALAVRNNAKTADLQIRLVRASELNSHLKEMNLAAAGLAHETRNPLNIIRGLAQMISRLPDASAEVRDKSRTIVDETDKVTAQLTEFINYSKPREVRRSKVDLAASICEVIRTLNIDISAKNLRVSSSVESLAIEADEQLLRQVLFNLLINAVQAAEEGGEINFAVRRTGPGEAILEVIDTGPGVPPGRRLEIFKPYFTTHQKGTGLGLAVVQQIVQAHGWEIQCHGNEPRGAIFSIRHLKLL